MEQRQEEELKFEDSSDIITNKGSISNRQVGLRRRMTSKKVFSNQELLKRIDVTELRTPSIEQRAKQAQVETRICEILQKGSKTDSDYETLDKYFSETPSFRAIKSEYDQKVAQQFLKMLTLYTYKPDEDILKYYASNDYFFYVIGGLVSVMLPTKLVKAFATDGDYAEYRKQHKNCIVKDRKLRGRDLEQMDPEDLTDPLMTLPNSLKIAFTFLEEVAVLRGKDGFGELSLKPKQPLAVCFRAKTNVTVARISRSDYAPLVKGAMSSKSVTFKDILMSIPFFSSFQPWTIEKLAGAIRLKNYTRKQYVFKEGDEVDNLYIVKEGEFDRSKTFAILTDDSGNTQLKGIIPGALSDPISLQQNQEAPAKNPQNEASPPRSPMKHINNKAGEKVIKLKVITENELFGEDEIVMKNRVRQSSVQCVGSSGILYAISKEALNEAIKASTTTEKLQKHVEENVAAVKEKLGTVSKYTDVKLPKLHLLKKKSYKPLTEQEKKEIRRKINTFRDRRLLERIKQSFPRYRADLTYQYYDSKIARGEREPMTLYEIINQSKPLPDFELLNVIQNMPKEALTPRENFAMDLSKERSDSDASMLLENVKKFKARKHRPMRERSDSIRKKAEKDLETMLLSEESPSPKNKRSQSTFVTSLNIQSSSPEREQVALPPINEVVQEEVSKGPLAISQALNDVAAEMVEQYKVMNNGSAQIDKKDIPAVLNTILQSNKYLQNMIKRVKFTQKKCSQKILKSKHNLYRFKSVSSSSQL